MITRRHFVSTTALAVVAGLLPFSGVWAQSSSEGASPSDASKETAPARPAPKPEGTGDIAELNQPGPLGDVWLGPEDAKVTIIEYASMTCSHCAHFHATTYPELKKRYIDTGKVRFTLREFPLDPRATAAFMLARCDGGGNYAAITDMLFDHQADWAFVRPPTSPIDALAQLLRQAGFSKEKVEGCLKDQKVYDGVNAVKTRALDTFKVESTPTFFINGQKYPGALTIDDIEKIIKPILGS